MQPSARLTRKNFQNGQGILEVIVTIAIGTILILALVVLSVRSNRSSDFSKANSQALNLAAEGLEFIKNLKVNNTASLVKIRTDCLNADLPATNWIGLFAADVDDSCTLQGRAGYLPSSPAPCTNTYRCLYFRNAADVETVTLNGRAFTRTVYIADTPTSSPPGKSNCNTTGADFAFIKQFTVVVSFTDSAGTHQSSQSSCITR